MDKRILILLAVVLLLVGLIVATVLLRNGMVEPAPIPTDEPVTIFPDASDIEDDPVPEGELRLSAKGGTVDVRDFRQDPQTTEDEGRFHRMYSFAEHPRYQISYSEYDNGFLIALLASPLGAVRREAEAIFLQALKIEEDEACRLNVSVGTIDSVSEQYAGKELGLSFCPGAVLLTD